MTIPDAVKQPVLRAFHEKLTQPGWTFSDCGPDEKDRDLLEHFDVVITELGHLDSASRDVIIDVSENGPWDGRLRPPRGYRQDRQ
jgi:farnesyl-diphosphate farnesyltransferase